MLLKETLDLGRELGMKIDKQLAGRRTWFLCPSCDGHGARIDPDTEQFQPCETCRGAGDASAVIQILIRGSEWIYWAIFPAGTRDSTIQILFPYPQGRRDEIHARPLQIRREGSRILGIQRCRVLESARQRLAS